MPVKRSEKVLHGLTATERQLIGHQKIRNTSYSQSTSDPFVIINLAYEILARQQTRSVKCAESRRYTFSMLKSDSAHDHHEDGCRALLKE